MRPKSWIRSVKFRNILESVLNVVFFLVLFHSVITISDNPKDEDECPIDEGGDITTIQIILQANIVLFGKIRTLYQNETNNGVYTAEMQVYCILKGEVTKRYINISNAGYIPAHCMSAKLQQDVKYVVIADYIEGKYVPVATEIPGTEQKLKEIMNACGVNPREPQIVRNEISATQDKDKDKEDKCPTANKPCIDESYFTTTTTTSSTTTTEEPDYLTDPTEDEIIEYSEDTESSSIKSWPTFATFSTSSASYEHLSRILQFLATSLLHVFVCILLNVLLF